LGRVPTDDMPLVCQRFERVHPAKVSTLPPRDDGESETQEHETRETQD
jgi:hypothetical protein